MLSLLLACLAYLSVALPGSTLGLLWPSMRLSLGQPVGALGILLAFGITASVISSAAAGRIRVRTGLLVAAGTMLTALALAAEALAPSLWLMTVGFVLFGLGFGAIDTALNVHAARHFGARDINWMHASYGLGATIGPLVATALLSAGRSWRQVYGVMAVMLAVMAGVLALARRGWQAPAPQAEPHPASPPAAAAAARVASSLTFAAVETGIESGAGIWGYLFLAVGRGLSGPAAGVAVSAYWAMMFAGRVVLGPVAQRLGAARVLAVAVAGVPLGAVLMAVPGPVALAVAGLMLLGLAAAPVFPLFTLTTGQRSGTARMVSLQVAASAAGNAAVPAGLGLAIAAAGPQMLAPSLLTLGLAMGVIYAVRSQGRPGPRLRNRSRGTYWIIMDIGQMLTWAADRYPGRIAVGGPRPLTYRQWDARTNQLARALAGLGVRPGDTVAFLLAGGEPMASLHLAVAKLGAVAVPLSIRFGPAELAYCLGDAGPALVVGDDTTQAALAGGPQLMARAELDERARPEPDGELTRTTGPEDLSVILYTSGTTGRPKGVPRTHRAEHAATVAHVIQTQHRPGEVTLGVMPLFHTMGIRTLLASILVAGTWVPQAKFDAEESLELIKSDHVSALYLVPTLYWSLLWTGSLPRAWTVKRIAYAGAPMTPVLAEELTGALHPEVFVNHFGSTEIYTFTIGPDARTKPGCAGRAGVFSRVRLVDPLDPATPVPPGTQGEVAVSMTSPEAFGGYRNRPDADARAIRDGWYLTGDLATEDDKGDLWVSGRVDDMIISGGENLHPDEIEAALARCPAVSAVVVVGLPDDRWGQAVTAFVVPAQDFSAERAVAHALAFAEEGSGLPSLKRPKRCVAVAHIPTSAVGKILRRELTEGRYLPLAEGRL